MRAAASRWRRSRTSPPGAGRHHRRRVGVQARRRGRRRRALRRRKPTSTTPWPIPSRSCAPTSSARSRCWRRCARHGVRLHHVSTDEVYGDLELGLCATVHRVDAVQPVEPVLVDEGRGRLAGARVGAFLRCAGDDLELLEQLRAVSTRGEVHSPPDHQRADRAAAQALRQRRERSRLDPRRRPQQRGVADPRRRSDRSHVSDRRRTGNGTTCR